MVNDARVRQCRYLRKTDDNCVLYCLAAAAADWLRSRFYSLSLSLYTVVTITFSPSMVVGGGSGSDVPIIFAAHLTAVNGYGHLTNSGNCIVNFWPKCLSSIPIGRYNVD